MQISRDKVEVLIKNGQAAGLTGKQVLDGLVQRGYEPEGVDVNVVRQQIAKEATAQKQSTLGGRVSQTIQEGRQKVQEVNAGDASLPTKIAQNAAEVTGLPFKIAFDVLPKPIRDSLTAVSDVVGKGINAGIDELSKTKLLKDIGDLEAGGYINPETAPDFYKLKDTLSGVSALGETAGNITGLEQGVTGVLKGGALAKDVATTSAKKAADTIESTVNKAVGKTKSITENAIERFNQPAVSEATKVSLNPTEALKGTGQDIEVSVGGKLKKLSQITPSEKTKIQTSTTKALDTFTKQAEKFSKDRSVNGGSPVEIVGSRTDSALDFADKKRITVGNKMGDIESAYATKQVPIGEKTMNAFAEITKFNDEPKFGIKSSRPEVTSELVKDFDKLEKAGATIADRNQMIREWQKFLDNEKDSFGQFKDNKYENTQIEKAINYLKNETVESIDDKTYKNLRKQYAEYKNLEKLGNSLLGKEGALGEKVKGSSVIKRAIQSNSDAGARQFLIKLRELTGYDAIKEGDLALTAMENVGDYQGLSLLNILKKGKSGIIEKALEKGEEALLGTRQERVKKYIKK